MKARLSPSGTLLHMATGYRPVTDPERLRTFFGVVDASPPAELLAGAGTHREATAAAKRTGAAPSVAPPGAQLQLPFSDDDPQLARAPAA